MAKGQWPTLKRWPFIVVSLLSVECLANGLKFTSITFESNLLLCVIQQTKPKQIQVIQGQSPLQFLLFSRVIGKLHTFFNTLSEKKVAEFPVIFSWNDITQNTFGFFLLGGCRHFMTNFQLSGRAFQHSTFRKNNLFDFTLSVKHNLSQVLLRLTLSMNYQCVRCEVNTVSYKLSILLFKQTS